MISLWGFHITFFQLAAAVFGIGVLVFVHELGHFFMAKYFRIRVEVFAFGFGPEIIGFTRGETRYSLRAIPFGGMVKMPGEDIDSASGSPDEFLSQPWYRRMAIAFMGPLMNYLFAILMFAAVIFFWGMSRPSSEALIGGVMDGYPAATAGLRAGDLVTAINGTSVNGWAAMAAIIHAAPEQSVTLSIQREQAQLQVSVTTRRDPSGIGVIGVSPAFDTVRTGLGGSLALGARMAVAQSIFTLKYLGDKLIRWEKPEVAGPLGVMQVLAKAARSGWENLLHLLAVISVALGLFNLLPIPLVDGGHIFMAGIEAVTRRRLSKKAVMIANGAGLAFILLVFVFATYSDLVRLGLSFGGRQ